ncbi:MAG: hypothetical protein ABII82_04510, partial [Verrucomicrobiota bacterium]
MNTKTRVTLLGLLLSTPALAADGIWANPAVGGDWNAPRNWKSGAVPGGVGSTVALTTETRELKTLKVDGGVTVGRLELDGAKAPGNGWKIIAGGGGAFTLATAPGANPPVIHTTNGSSFHLIGAPIRGAQGYTKAGNGHLLVTADNPYTGLTTVTDGKLSVNAPAGLGATGAGNG